MFSAFPDNLPCAVCEISGRSTHAVRLLALWAPCGRLCLFCVISKLLVGALWAPCGRIAPNTNSTNLAAVPGHTRANRGFVLQIHGNNLCCFGYLAFSFWGGVLEGPHSGQRVRNRGGGAIAA